MPELNSVLAIDVGSTTTKAILFETRDGKFRLTDWAGAPTTVEKPHEDVIIGVKNAITLLEQQVGRSLFSGEGEDGIDAFVATSSAGGGLQMVVGGVIKEMTAESAYKAALGAGAIVMDVFAANDGRSDLEKIKRIQELRPDMILLSGGIDGGNVEHVVALAEIVALARPKSRLGQNFRLPVVFAGNSSARPEVDKFLQDTAVVSHVDNIRPVLEEEVLEPASEEIHRLFLEHVMSQAPGYEKLLELTDGSIMPTPSAVGRLIQTLGEENEINVMAVDIGGATTDVFSSFVYQRQKVDRQQVDRKTSARVFGYFLRHYTVEERRFHRSVNANLGMSYSIGNVLAEAGGENILRWLPFDIKEDELRDWLSNKMIRPTVIPQTPKALLIEQALAREAIRLSIESHKFVAAGLKGVAVKRSFSEIFTQKNVGRQSIIDSLQLDVIIGSGGVISHAPNRNQALLILLDSFQPEGVTELYVDSIFMMPHLGVISTLDTKKAFEALKADCLIPLGTCIAPIGPYRPGKVIAKVEAEFKDGRRELYSIVSGHLGSIPLPAGEEAVITVLPAYGYDCGEGPGRQVEALAVGGTGGLILDGRGRPIVVDSDPYQRIAQLRQWSEELQAYPEHFFEGVQ